MLVGFSSAHGYPTEDADAKECVSHHRQRVEHCPPVRLVSFEPFPEQGQQWTQEHKPAPGTGWRGSLFILSHEPHPLQS